MSNSKKFDIQLKSLLLIDGQSAIQQSGETMRYVYDDGSIDPRSTVDPRTLHLEVDEDSLAEIMKQRRAAQDAGFIALNGERHDPKVICL